MRLSFGEQEAQLVSESFDSFIRLSAERCNHLQQHAADSCRCFIDLTTSDETLLSEDKIVNSSSIVMLRDVTTDSFPINNYGDWRITFVL